MTSTEEMTETTVCDGDPTMMSEKETEMKKELQRLVRVIVDDDNFSVDVVDRAAHALFLLKELKSEKPVDLKLQESLVCPEEFRCPISRELMRDPVIVSTGQTYDRPFIQRWLKAGHRTCPKTQQVLSHTLLTPNLLVGNMISQWCNSHGIQMQHPVYDPNQNDLTDADREHFVALLDKMTSSLPDQKDAARQLRSLTKRMPSFRALFGESTTAIHQLLSPVSKSKPLKEIQPDLQEDLITTLLNLSIHDNNKKCVAEMPMVIPLLMDALKCGTIETKSNAAATLFTLSALDSNKTLIGKSGALKPLIELLEDGHPLAMKDVASAIFNLCIQYENKVRAVRDGGVRVILKKIMNRIHVDELLAILAMLSSSPKAVEEIIDLDGVTCLLKIIRENHCERSKENSIAILHTICFSDRTKWKEMKDEESSYGTISKLAKDGSSRAKRKAGNILDRLNKPIINFTHTA